MSLQNSNINEPEEELEEGDNDIDDEVKEIMENQDLDEDEAEEVKEIMDEYDLDEDDAVELKDEL